MTKAQDGRPASGIKLRDLIADLERGLAALAAAK
jgi:hypothetical protein